MDYNPCPSARTADRFTGNTLSRKEEVSWAGWEFAMAEITIKNGKATALPFSTDQSLPFPSSLFPCTSPPVFPLTVVVVRSSPRARYRDFTNRSWRTMILLPLVTWRVCTYRGSGGRGIFVPPLHDIPPGRKGWNLIVSGWKRCRGQGRQDATYKGCALSAGIPWRL